MTAPYVLLVIDLQQAIDDPRWAVAGPRNNPDAEAVVARLLAHWRAKGWPVIHVRHDSPHPGSPYRVGAPGHAFKAQARPLPGEPVVAKRVNTAFIGTDLEKRLRYLGGRVAVCGVLTDNSVEATARAAGDLGLETVVIEDACFAYAVRDRLGLLHDADTVHALTLARLDGEYARVMTSDQVVSSV